jgi:hypothetical protein
MTTVQALYSTTSSINEYNTLLLPEQNTGHLYINNTFRIGHTDGVEGNPPFNNANIGLKDQGDGNFYDLFLSNTDLYLNTGNGIVYFVRNDELETILNNDPVIFSNVYVSRATGNGYISFVNDHTEIGGTPNLGFRASNGVMQFRNAASNTWANIGTAVETFVSNIQAVTTTSNILIPVNTVGIKVRAIGAGGAGGAADTSIYSQGGGGGAGGFVELAYQSPTLSNMYLQVNIGQGTSTIGGNSTVHLKTNITDPANPSNMLLDAYGGQPGETFNTVTYESSGGSGGSGQISGALTNAGYVIQGQRGQPGYYSENQNLRYYHGGRGADSTFGSGGAGAFIGTDASSAGYGCGGGGGIYYNDGASNTGVQVFSNGGSGYAVVEFYTAAISTVGAVATNYFYQLLDTNIDLSQLNAKPYLKYGALSKVTNVELNIGDDPAPTLGGTLDTNGYNIQIANNTGIQDSTGNLAIEFNSSNSGTAHLLVKAGKLPNGDDVAEITANSSVSAASAGLYIHPKGTADIDMSTNTAASINITTGSVVIDNTSSVELNSGYIKTSYAFYDDGELSTSSGSRTLIPTTSDLIIFQITGDDGRYYTSVDAGVMGQHANFIYDAPGTNNIVYMSFINGANTASVGVGSGLATELVYDTPGQSAHLVYLQFGSPYDTANIASRSRWQVVNGGCNVIN